MRVFISVVSHNHKNILKELGCVKELSKSFTVIIKNNTSESFEDIDFKDCYIIEGQKGRGFAENNNIIFKHAVHAFDASGEDFFIIYNPDVIISTKNILNLLNEMTSSGSMFSTINLFTNKDMTIHDNSIRRFPVFFDFVSSFLGMGNRTLINKNEIKGIKSVDWCSGAFMAFKVNHYDKLSGFNQNYFMYCEDIDICLRSSIMGNYVKYHPTIKAIHLAQHRNKVFFSRHFLWHVKSALLFLYYKRRGY